MKLGKQAIGSDRHLFGLQMAANQTLDYTPSIFLDKAFKLSGGNGNFSVSTSFGGYHDVTGTTTPMVQDGYGIYYNIPKSK